MTELKKINRYRSEDNDYWVNMKDKYKGKRGFIIGNGPSLLPEDLEALKNEISIASNRIYLMYPKTNWRPTVYTIADSILWPKIKDEVKNLNETVHLPNYLKFEGSDNVKYWKSPFSIGGRKFSLDITEGAYGGHTVTYENIQIAMYLGLNPIYLIGCDHNYPGEKDVTAGIAIKQGSEQTHFTKEYRVPGEKVLPASILNMEASYRAANQVANEHGVEIFNATRGGRLDVFNRADLDKLVN